ncbi:MAG TPA: sulfotransferase, partial [Novosphingobium sp.]|nr:sulfotransferase [Novosphingobium sp.]
MAGEKVRIEDLKNPVRSELQLQALAYGETNRVSLTPQAVLAAAEAATGLSDYGADDFRPRLKLWLECCDADEGMSGSSRIGIF